MNNGYQQIPQCAPLPDAKEMARWDSAAVLEGNISAIKLMANAGEGALRGLKAALAERQKDFNGPERQNGSERAGQTDEKGRPAPDMPVLQGLKILLFMGRGNNGGDAAVLARLALREGAEVLLCHLHPLPKNLASTQDAADVHLRAALDFGVTALRLPTADAPLPAGWDAPDVIVDGLLGTGFTPPLRADMAMLIERINALSLKISDASQTPGSFESSGRLTRRPWLQPSRAASQANVAPLVLALDIPSGLSATNGTPSPIAVAADMTITFEAPKPGLLLPAAVPWLGKLLIHPVGIPLAVQAKYPPAAHVLLPGCAQAGRGLWQMAHKGRAGRVLIVGGSAGLTGAPHLSALGALRGGAGLVRIACPAGLNAQVKYDCPDIMTLPLGAGFTPAPEGWSESFVHQVMLHMAGSDALVIGPGLGLSGGVHAFAAALLAACSEEVQLPPLVLDADALTVLADTPELIAALPMTSVFTPHPGEAARLLKCSVADVEADRRAALAELMDLLPGTVLLKGAGTLIGRGGDCYFLPFIEPNLAVGGSGDVLSGLIAAYLAHGADVLSAACAGAYVHGLCGHMLREVVPARGNLASEIASTIPRARALAARLPGHWLPTSPFNQS